MKFIKISMFLSLLNIISLPIAQAEDVTTLPSIKVMAESELRDEVVTMAPLQDDKNVRKSLQQKIIKSEQDIQNHVIGDNFSSINVQAQAVEPDWSQLDKYGDSAALKAYVQSVASGLQSADPTSGIFKMLEPLGVDRDKALSTVKNGGGAIQINFDQQRLNQLLNEDWQLKMPSAKR